MKHDFIRMCTFRPYRTRPIFVLRVWDTYQSHNGHYQLGYSLTMDGKTLFEGEDFGCSPMHAIDSDATMADLMGFLTLKPGDTDSEYFAGYTQEQLDYCSEHADALHTEVVKRFGEF